MVVLPAPFGPRKPVIVPGSSVNDRSSTAKTDPNRFVSDSATTAVNVAPRQYQQRTQTSLDRRTPRSNVAGSERSAILRLAGDYSARVDPIEGDHDSMRTLSDTVGCLAETTGTTADGSTTRIAMAADDCAGAEGGSRAPSAPHPKCDSRRAIAVLDRLADTSPSTKDRSRRPSWRRRSQLPLRPRG